MKKLVLVFLALFVFALPLSFALADAGSNAPTLIDAGAPSDAGSASPSSQLDDPIAAPGAAWDDLKAARKTGWALALLGGLIMLLRSAAHASKRHPRLAFLAKGKAAVGIATAIALTSAAFDSLALGGSWVAMAIAAGGSLLALLVPTSPVAKEVSA